LLARFGLVILNFHYLIIVINLVTINCYLVVIINQLLIKQYFINLNHFIVEVNYLVHIFDLVYLKGLIFEVLIPKFGYYVHFLAYLILVG
jgi:hypothetical protein